MKTKSIEEIKAYCEEYANALGIRIVEVEFKQGKNPALTFFIDKDGGVDLDTCEKFHNAIDLPLDEFDPTFGGPYTLNISSRGIDWAFKTDEDFNSHIGKRVEVRLKNTVKGKKFFDGTLIKYDGNNIVIKVDEKLTMSFELKTVVKVNEYIDF